MNTIDLSNATKNELKAIAYDTVIEIERLTKNLQTIRNQIVNKENTEFMGQVLGHGSNQGAGTALTGQDGASPTALPNGNYADSNIDNQETK
jgi:hypothetical protein